MTKTPTPPKKPSSQPESELQYQIKLTKEQASVISKALDVYSRLGAGQFQELMTFATVKDLDFAEIEKIFVRLKELMFDLPGHTYLGIGGVSDSCRVSYDLHQVIRHRLAWDNDPRGGYQVWFDRPMKFGTERLAEMSKIEATVPTERPKRGKHG